MVSAVTATASKVAISAKVLPIIEVGTVDAEFMCSIPLVPYSGDQAPKLPTEGEMREGKKKKKAIAKTPRKARFSEPNDDSDE